jgi:X-X-X-Leu-X-X-Gly heptad repeat protein
MVRIPAINSLRRETHMRVKLLPQELRGPNLAALIAEADQLTQKAGKLADGLRTLQARTDPTAWLAARRRKWKLANGTHLSERGKAKIRQKMAEGWSDYRIAKLLDISVPAVKPYRTAA